MAKATRLSGSRSPKKTMSGLTSPPQASQRHTGSPEPLTLSRTKSVGKDLRQSMQWAPSKLPCAAGGGEVSASQGHYGMR